PGLPETDGQSLTPRAAPTRAPPSGGGLLLRRSPDPPRENLDVCRASPGETLYIPAPHFGCPVRFSGPWGLQPEDKSFLFEKHELGCGMIAFS
ncbi:MAG: hypothetical protein WCD11_10670, partial [Solirubrobacteraceae bacterium]